MDNLKRLIEFTQNISKSKLLDVTEKGKSTMDNLFRRLSKDPDFLTNYTSDFVSEFNLKIDKEVEDIFFLTSYSLNWSRGETYTKEGYLEGGFSFNGIKDMYRNKHDYWKDTVKSYEKYEKIVPVNYELLNKLKWLDSLFCFFNSSSDDIYYASCVLLKENELPSQFYFFDGGLVFNLLIDSIPNYVSALIDSGAVAHWQYFYVSPEELIAKNNGINYMTWVIHRSNLCEGINDLQYHEDIKFDRLDLVAEHIERCVRILPKTFPFLDFSYHKEHYRKFKVLYDEVRPK